MDAEKAALERIAQNPKGPDLTGKQPGTVLNAQQANKNAAALHNFGGRSISDLSSAASNPINKEGLTEAARALTKHAAGQRETGTFPKLSGGIEKKCYCSENCRRNSQQSRVNF
ncbi:TPA: hypothetical protein ACNFRY_005602 [Pseudomonas aeruginosa]|uniref:hypothetical protein n=1 Tax=Pseudomonas aeruginosa TaxID=287 RepID=UPI0012AC7DCE|nr:hypothetical protein [Pseudomonas aeruginosa]MBG4983013.1 hypothetical protein [Pseudomonas aeruginosa]MDC3995291.1 hypothetical protein [Pseudomonas aeruginosa]HBO2188348.1 hypothetical protein [Pseudomonas aeruginosa]HCF2591443.1 hypothetical protein [Pseudomonas aeruginosa]HCL3995902.1 hypothetical protein [Pseudomonas aeruginosa]